VCRKLVLATGDMHGPNRLGIPGEDLPHVSHYFQDVHPYFRKRLLIVGGRNSAAEAALRCWRAGAQVSLSYRRLAFDAKIIKHWILPDLETQIELGNIEFFPETVPVEITPAHVLLERVNAQLCPTGERSVHPADFVLLNTGFEADMGLYAAAGIELVGPEQKPIFDPQTMETNVTGLYLAGTAAAGKRQRKYTLFVENTHVHVGRIVKALTGQWPDKLGTLPHRSYELPLEAIQAN
jgi:thioredoxin reductase (NADPH)